MLKRKILLEMRQRDLIWYGVGQYCGLKRDNEMISFDGGVGDGDNFHSRQRDDLIWGWMVDGDNFNARQ